MGGWDSGGRPGLGRAAGTRADGWDSGGASARRGSGGDALGAGEDGLEVGALGEADRVVDRLSGLADDVQVPAGPAGGAAARW